MTPEQKAKINKILESRHQFNAKQRNEISILVNDFGDKRELWPGWGEILDEFYAQCPTIEKLHDEGILVDT